MPDAAADAFVVSCPDAPLPHTAFFHDYLVTENYYVLFQNPLTARSLVMPLSYGARPPVPFLCAAASSSCSFGKHPLERTPRAAPTPALSDAPQKTQQVAPQKLLGFVFFRNSAAELMTFDRSRPMIVHLIPRRGDPDAGRKSFPVEPAHFSFHHCNAYETGDGRVIADRHAGAGRGASFASLLPLAYRRTFVWICRPPRVSSMPAPPFPHHRSVAWRNITFEMNPYDITADFYNGTGKKVRCAPLIYDRHAVLGLFSVRSLLICCPSSQPAEIVRSELFRYELDLKTGA